MSPYHRTTAHVGQTCEIFPRIMVISRGANHIIVLCVVVEAVDPLEMAPAHCQTLIGWLTTLICCGCAYMDESLLLLLSAKLLKSSLYL